MTNGAENCPLPEVADALGLFIKPRDEVTAIRLELQNYLNDQLRNDESPLSPVNLTEAVVSPQEPPPAALSGVRKAYWKAAQTHTAAQAKYDALKAELERLKHSKSGAEVGRDSQRSHTLDDGYIPLLRQREKYRKLKVIDRALLEILSVSGGSSAGSLDDEVRKKIGDLPTPPSTQPRFNESPHVDAKILELKKAVISSKRKVDANNAKIVSRYSPSAGNGKAEADVAGLQNVLQELTTWMENQLTLIANAEAQNASNIESPIRNGTPSRSPASAEDIEELYEHYLHARQRLILNANDTSDQQPDPSTAELGLETRALRNADVSKASNKTSAETILPYIPTLVAAKQDEQTLLQHSAYIRRQLTTAEGHTERLIHRLADESHLVNPGASRGKDWSHAAATASNATDEFVMQRLQAGETSARAAKEALESIHELPKALGRLIEKT